MSQKHSLLSHNFNTQDIIALLKMALGEHSIMIPNDEVAAMAPLLMSATEGLKGLTGACLHQVSVCSSSQPLLCVCVGIMYEEHHLADQLWLLVMTVLGNWTHRVSMLHKSVY